MSDRSAPPERPLALMRPGRWPGIVWALPLAALILVAYLGLQAYAQRGIDVEVTFDSGAGVRAGATQVFYKGVVAGRVTRVELNPDGRRFDMTLRLDPRSKPVLVTGTVFAFIGAKPSLTDISSIRAALAGVSIGLYPSDDGAPTRRFVGLDEPPIVPPRSSGRTIVFTTRDPGSIQRGSDVSYHSIAVGKVMSVRLDGLQSAVIEAFVQAPYDRLVRPDSAFWKASPLQLSLSGQGIGASFKPAAALAGEVAFDTPQSAASEAPAASGARFTLYASEAEADTAPKGPEVLYQAIFDAPTGDLKIGSPVTLRGFPIGAIRDIGFAFDEATGVVSTPVTFGIAPGRLGLSAASPQPEGYWRPRTDAALARLIARGWRVRLRQTPPLLGARAIDIELEKGAPRGRIDYAGAYPRLPSSAAGDTAALLSTANQILDRVNALPIEAIGQSVRRTVERLDRLTGSPEVADSLHHLDATLSELDQLAHEVRPQAGALVAKLNETADQLQQTAAGANRVLSGQGAGQDESLPGAVRELTDAARSVRALTDYLARHPEAVIRGKAKAP
jgi:paraquat-inducible protein B